jgi:hypothetical protein
MLLFATHYSCAAARDGRACKIKLRVRRDVAERVILTPIVDQLLAPELITEMATEIRRYYNELVAEAKTEKAKLAAAVIELGGRIARLRERLKAGDDDMTADEIMAVIERAEAKREDLLSLQPEAKRNEKIIHALPGA